MRIGAVYSHLNGQEWLLVHYPELWREVEQVVRVIDVGIEMLPTKSLQRQMSSGVPYYEGALYDVVRQGRASPPVPVVLVGLEC